MSCELNLARMIHFNTPIWSGYIPDLSENSVVVMDNAAFHQSKKREI
jgi:hypothetical protein